MPSDTERVILALLDCGKDASDTVREEIEASCARLGLRDPQTFLELAREFLTRNQRGLTPPHRAVIFASMHQVLHEKGKELANGTLLPDLLKFVIAEMTKEKEGAGDWQTAACTLVVEICCLCPVEGGQQLLAQIPTMQLPHYFVLKALADFARTSPKKFIPHLKVAMTKILPLLSLVKQDSMKWVFSTAIGRFSEAVLQYNEGEADPKETYALSEFAASMSTALNVVHSEWVNAREQKVRAAACEALGHLAPIVPQDVLSSSFSRIISTLTTLLKREKLKDGLPIIHGLQAVLDTSSTRIPDAVRNQLPDLWGSIQTLFCQVAALPAREQVGCNRHSNELLRCAEVLARTDPDYALTHIQRQFDPKVGGKDPASRAATLAILRHVVSRLEVELAAYRDTVIATLKAALPDTDYRVRKAVIQNVIAMGPSENRYLACEGGQDLLYYIVRNASIAPNVIAEWNIRMASDTSPAAAVSPEEVRGMCTNVLHVFVTSVATLDDVLWPVVLEYMGTKEADGPELFYSFPAVCHCIYSLAERLKDTNKFGVHYDTQVNLPKPAEIVGKFMVHVTQCDPDNKEPTLAIVKAMLAVAPILTQDANDTAVPDLWVGTVPQLLDYLKGSHFDAVKWEDVNHKLMISTLNAKPEERWVELVGNALMSQASAYNTPDKADYKRVAMSMLGAVVSKSGRREYIRTALEFILDNTDHTQLKHRQGCAKALGFISTAHGDAVMDKLAALARPSRTASTWLATIAEYADMAKGTGEVTRATALLGYGHVVQRTQQQLMTSRLETNIIPSIIEMLGAAKTQEVKEAGLLCVDLLGKGVKKVAGFQFRSKENAINCVLQTMNLLDKGRSRNAYVLTVAGLRAVTTMLALDPKVTSEMVTKLVQSAFAVVAKVFDSPTERDAERERDKDRDLLVASKQVAILRMPDEERPSDRDEVLLRQELGLMLCGLLDDSPTQTRLLDILLPLGDSMQCDNSLVRERALACILCLIRRYNDLLAGQAATFERETQCLGTVIGLLVPRMSDTCASVRQMACSGIHAILQLNNRFESDKLQQEKVDDMLLKLLSLREALASREAKDLFTLAKQMSNFLAAVLMPKHITKVIECLLNSGLTDSLDDAANGACVVLNGLVHKNGSKLEDSEVSQYTLKMISTIPRVRSKENSLLGVLHCIKSLSKHRVNVVCEALLGFSIPFEPHVLRVIDALATEPSLAQPLLTHLLDVMVNCQVFEDPKSKGGDAEMSQRAVAAVTLLAELMDLAAGGTADHIVSVAQSLKPAMTCMLLLLLCAAHDATKGVVSRSPFPGKTRSAVKQVSTAFSKWTRNMFGRSCNEWLRQQKLLDQLNVYDNAMYAAAIPGIISCTLAEEALLHEEKDSAVGATKAMPTGPTQCTPMLLQYYDFIQPYVNKAVDAYRLGAIAITGQLLYHCKGNADMVQGITNCLLGRTASEVLLPAKRLAVEALRHTAAHPLSNIGTFITPLTTTLLSCLGHEDSTSNVVLQALGTLHHLITQLEPGSHWNALVTPICMRLRPAMDNEDSAVRGECFKVLTALCELCSAGHVDHAVMEHQMFDNLPYILVHVNDNEVIVRQPAKQALHAVCAWLIAQCEKTALKSLMERPSYQSDKKMEFDEFSRDFSVVWVKEYSSRVPDLLAALHSIMRLSARDPIKANAATLSGCFVSHLDAEGWRRCNVEQTTSTLIALASTDKSELVRQKAIKALGLYPS